MYSSYLKAIRYDEVDKKSEDADDRQSIDFGSESENSGPWENEPETSSASPLADCFVFSQTHFLKLHGAVAVGALCVDFLCGRVLFSLGSAGIFSDFCALRFARFDLFFRLGGHFGFFGFFGFVRFL